MQMSELVVSPLYEAEAGVKKQCMYHNKTLANVQALSSLLEKPPYLSIESPTMFLLLFRANDDTLQLQ